jgi:hypothetical protein
MGLFTTEIKYQPNKKPKQGVYGQYLEGANTTPSLTNLSIVGMPTATYGANIPTTAQQTQPQPQPVNYQLSGATYGGNTPTPTEEKIYTEKVDVKYSDGNSDGNGTKGGTGDGNESKMTYGQWLDAEKKRQEEVYKDSLYTAQLNEERAIANAQSSYAQNKATYGTNAETLGQMGLTGGGYSDYLNAQAYSEKQNAVNTANINRLNAEKEAKATYEDNISKLNASQFDYDEKQQTQDGIGIDGGEDGVEIDLSTNGIISSINNGDYTGYDRGGLESMLRQNVMAGKMDADDIPKVLQAYDIYNAYVGKKITDEEYQAYLKGDENANTKIKFVVDKANANKEARQKAVEISKSGIKDKDITDVLNIYYQPNLDRWGKFSGTGKGGSQDTYLKAIIQDAKNNDIGIGKIVIPNFGYDAGKQEYWMYIGNGTFVKLAHNRVSDNDIHMPNGYKVTKDSSGRQLADKKEKE